MLVQRHPLDQIPRETLSAMDAMGSLPDPARLHAGATAPSTPTMQDRVPTESADDGSSQMDIDMSADCGNGGSASRSRSRRSSKRPIDYNETAPSFDMKPETQRPKKRLSSAKVAKPVFEPYPSRAVHPSPRPLLPKPSMPCDDTSKMGFDGMLFPPAPLVPTTYNASKKAMIMDAKQRELEKRSKNTEAARKYRERRHQRVLEMEELLQTASRTQQELISRINDLRAEREAWLVREKELMDELQSLPTLFLLSVLAEAPEYSTKEQVPDQIEIGNLFEQAHEIQKNQEVGDSDVRMENEMCQDETSVIENTDATLISESSTPEGNGSPLKTRRMKNTESARRYRKKKGQEIAEMEELLEKAAQEQDKLVSTLKELQMEKVQWMERERSLVEQIEAARRGPTRYGANTSRCDTLVKIEDGYKTDGVGISQ